MHVHVLCLLTTVQFMSTYMYIHAYLLLIMYILCLLSLPLASSLLVMQIEQAKATAESDKLAAETDLLKAQRQVEALERELQELRNGGKLPEAMRIEVDRRMEVGKKLSLAEAKCSELMDKCDVSLLFGVPLTTVP